MIGIIGILNNPATSLNSHSAGMVYIVSKLFNAKILTETDEWDKFDELIIYHGVNFKEGSFNVIGGINDKIMERANKLSSFKGKVSTLDGFQLNDFSKKRKLVLWDDVNNIGKVSLPSKPNIVIGDSHSLSVWPNSEYEISRNDGKTLHGFLKMDVDLSKYTRSILYFGNIDIRFHLMRQSNPKKATVDLFSRYCEYANKYGSTITQLLPIENESRIIPGTGKYKGKNFFGSWEERNELRDLANNVMSESGLNIIKWPDYFKNDLGELKFDVMEPKQSVHIKPKFYIRNQYLLNDGKLF